MNLLEIILLKDQLIAAIAVVANAGNNLRDDLLRGHVGHVLHPLWRGELLVHLPGRVPDGATVVGRSQDDKYLDVFFIPV